MSNYKLINIFKAHQIYHELLIKLWCGICSYSVSLHNLCTPCFNTLYCLLDTGKKRPCE